MKIIIKKGKSIWLLIYMLLVIATFSVFVSILNTSLIHVSAHSGNVFGSACGAATIDGNVDPAEWSSASTQTFQMVSPGIALPFTATLYVMNSAKYLYLGITINDDEFSTDGQFLPAGDGFRIDFDNDHSGSLFALHDDVLEINAGLPQFADYFVNGNPIYTSADTDVNGGGTSDGAGAASRVGSLNHFELKHPLCSSDLLDYCLHPNDTVGFRLEYLDAEANGTFGGSQFFPGNNDTSEADIVIGHCSTPDFFVYLPLLMK